MSGINKAYVQRQINIADSAKSDEHRKDALYRAGTHMDAIECSCDGNLTPEIEAAVRQAASKLLQE